MEFAEKTSEITVQSKTGDALKIIDLTLFVYDNEYMSNAIATCKVEVTPLACMYT